MNMEKLKNALAEYTGQKTLPNIFVGMQHIGGLNDLKKMIESG
jgi:glutaredoxin